MRHNKKHGFTLLELCLVLIVIALITGGIMVTQSLIRSSQLQSTIGDVARYTQALQTFQDKYHALPGDFNAAEAIWGSDDSCPNTTYTATPHTKTCNGNGDGMIGHSSSAMGWSNYLEIARAWQQLANAGLISGSYNGINGTGLSMFVGLPGINSPATPLPGGGYSLWFEDDPASAAAAYAMHGHVLLVGAADASRYTDKPLFTATEAYGIDVKMDDGLPATGEIKTMNKSWQPNCVSSDDATVAQYSSGVSSTLACVLYFHLGF